MPNPYEGIVIREFELPEPTPGRRLVASRVAVPHGGASGFPIPPPNDDMHPPVVVSAWWKGDELVVDLHTFTVIV